jgi:hypothetical protein
MMNLPFIRLLRTGVRVIASQAKALLNRVGYYIPMQMFGRLQSAFNYLYVGRWMRDKGYSPAHVLKDRRELIATVAKPICDAEVLYMEFGVHQGESIRQWAELLRNRASRLHGFDSFEGLPEEWDAHGYVMQKGHFSTMGVVPDIPDDRVKFFKGWFDNTLPLYEFIDSPVLVIFIDADLYSSTSYVLKTLRPHIKVGTLIYFDEFWDRLHELKAFEEFLSDTGMKFELVAITPGMRNVVFRRI